MKRQWLCVALLVGLAAPVRAQTPGEPIRLTIHPAAAPSPALKFRLLPNVLDLKPGNGALLYYRAFSPDWFSWRNQPGIQDKIVDALKTPLKDLPRKDLDWVLRSHQLKEFDLAARREHCDWALLERLRTDGIGLLLPDMQGFRTFANLLALRARFEMADGHYDQAAYCLQTGFGLARDIGKAPTLICSLVATACSAIQAGQVEQWLQLRGTPNLYWALTELPRPFIPLHDALESEKLWLAAEFTPINDLETTVYGPEKLQDLTQRLAHFLRVAEDSRQGSDETAKLALMALALKFYPEAKRALLAEGRKSAEVEAMPMLQVYTIHALHEYHRHQDELFKWFSLPYAEGTAGLARADQALRTAFQQKQGMPFALLLPAVTKVHAATARLDRRLAALRCVEALRLFAATHDGALPNALAEITEVPVPHDPMTGEAFQYRVSGNKATLHGPVPASDPQPQNNLTYEITLER
jgi:hypothetical protein